MEKLVTVGKIRDAHGLRGELFVVLFAKEAAWVDQLKEINLVRKEEGDEGLVDQLHRFPLRRHKPHKAGLIVRPEGISDRTEAESFRGALFQIPESLLVSQPGENIYLGEILHFEAIHQGEVLGKICGFTSNGPQDIVQVRRPDNTVVEIPLVEPILQKVNFDQKTVEFALPEGLVDL